MPEPSAALPVDAPSQLSHHQERLWFLQRLEPEDASYNIFWVQRLHGPLDLAVLGGALDDLAARHEVLRTSYPEADGVPAARVAAPAPVPVELVELPEGDVAEAERQVCERVSLPFDLAAGAPLRVSMLRLGARDHVLCLVVHHIAADGWSLRIIGNELSALYAARAEGKPSPLPALAATHRDWVDELRAQTGQARSRAALDHWTRALAGTPDLALPTDLPRAPVRDPAGALHKQAIPGELIAAVDRLAREQRGTAFMVLLAAYQVLLGRLTGQQDFAVGTPVAGRTRLEHEDVVGCLAGTVALRAELSGAPTFRELVRRVRNHALEAFTHQELPFAELLRALDVVRDRSRTPVFQTMFALQHTGPAGRSFTLGDAHGELFDVRIGQAKCDLALEVWRGPESTECHLSYATGLFTDGTARRLTDRYLTLLAALVAEPDRPVDDAELLPERERTELLRLGEGAALVSRPGATAAERFLDQARRTPTAPALDWDGGSWTYAELERRSAGIAALLAARDVGPGDVVGVFVERSPELVAALLGVWRTGAAYLPLDPRHTAARTALALDDAQAACVLVSARSAPRLPAGTAAPAVAVEQAASLAPVPDRLPDASAPAYVLYTSGSTGRPKGVVVGHASLAAFLDATAALVGGTGPEAAWLGLTSVSFDISGLETHLPLTTGGRLVLPGEEQAAQPGTDALRLAREHGVTHYQATPSAWELLLAAGFDAAAATVLTGGEALPVVLAAELRRRTARVFNMYGPTETTIWSSCWQVPAGPERVSLGTAIPGTRLMVLDGRGRPSPVGVPGELHIGGAGVADGYLGRPELTADRFLPDPWGPPGSRMYRTGDLVRHRYDGTLEFLGRLDDQVKVRGHRIELGEVEAALRACPGVRQAAAALRGTILVGYVTGTAEPDRLRAVLAAALPAYAVPSALVVLDALPTTPNGKLDRGALPEPGPGQAQGPADHVYQGAAAELHAIWCEVLGADTVGPDEDLFDLGGHSLVIARIAARVRDRLGVDLPLHQFFDTPTIRELAEVLEHVEPAS
ncbi:amino acid adenylation domain-containing protein [Streptomyces sp. NPDC048623]|uniref:non-ribosomal peptide synthetase n=1 Tax=Streptomyces sp. NPDC048623 TaxID=3155761 RepID=UPI00343915FE